MRDIPQVALPPELRAVRERWLPLQRKEQDDLYAREFAAPFARLFAELPLYGAPASMPRPRALVSLLGFSWQPVALMAAWCRPERILLLGTDESLALKVAGEGVVSVIARVAGVDRDRIETRRVGDPVEADIYRAVRDFLSSGIAPREVFIDPTGGKKSMSAAAALAAFLAGSPLVYVDYKEYHGPNRIPVAGTEYPRLLTNPLEVLGDLERRDVFAALNRSDFEEAERLAQKLAARLYEPREAEALTDLAGGYAAWDRFNFAAAREKLAKADRTLAGFADIGKWTWAEPVRPRLAENLRALESLANLTEKPGSVEAGLPLVIWYLAAAQRMIEADKASLAVLLLYAAMERYLDLCLWVEYGLDDAQPDYSRVESRLDWDRYDQAGKELFGKNYEGRKPEGKLMFANSAHLLATLAPHRLELGDLGPLKGLSEARNKCEYEHGFLPKIPAKELAEKCLSAVKRIVARGCDPARLEEMLASYRFPRFPEAGRS